MSCKQYLLNNWGKESLDEISKNTNLSISEIFKLALMYGLNKVSTPDIKRRWTEAEDEFLKTNSKKIDVRGASNLLYRSHHGTYQRVKYLGLEEMIDRNR
ncbi:hypothetical protein [Mammaliicoccus sciuri]